MPGGVDLLILPGKSRRAVDNIQWRDDNQVTLTVDTWMGETRPVVSVENDKLSGFLVGNARYPIDGTRLDAVPKGIPPVVPELANEANLLGGEAALWAETWSRRCWISVCGRAPLRWRSGYGRQRTSTTSTTCIPGSKVMEKLVHGIGWTTAAYPAKKGSSRLCQQRGYPSVANSRPGA